MKKKPPRTLGRDGKAGKLILTLKLMTVKKVNQTPLLRPYMVGLNR